MEVKILDVVVPNPVFTHIEQALPQQVRVRREWLQALPRKPWDYDRVRFRPKTGRRKVELDWEGLERSQEGFLVYVGDKIEGRPKYNWQLYRVGSGVRIKESPTTTKNGLYAAINAFKKRYGKDWKFEVKRIIGGFIVTRIT